MIRNGDPGDPGFEWPKVDYQAEAAALRVKVRDLEAENAVLQARLDSLRPMLERMGVTFSEEAPT